MTQNVSQEKKPLRVIGGRQSVGKIMAIVVLFKSNSLVN